MIKMTELRIGSALMTGGNIFQSATAFAVNLVLVRYISPADFGRFAIVFAEASLLFAVISIRTNTLVIRASEAALTERAKDMYFNAALQETVLATVLIFLWLGVTDGIGPWDAAIVLTLAVRHWTALNKAFFERSLPYTQLSVIETGAALGGQATVLAAVMLGAGWIALVLREVMLSVAILFGLAAFNGVTLRRVRLLTVDEYRQLYREARGVWLDGLLEGTFQRITVMAAGYLGGEALAGILFQAQRLAMVPHQVLSPFVNRIIMNWFARTEDTDLRRKGRDRAVLLTVPALAVVAVVTVLFAEPVVPWLLGDDWASVGTVLIGMAGFIVFISPFEILRSYSYAIHRTRDVLAARVSQHAGFFLPVGLWYVGWVSISDALAYGFSCAFAAAFITLLWLILRNEKSV